MTHRIRLGPPWEVATTKDGRSLRTRRFGRPANLTDERVWLVAEFTEANLNGEPVTLPADITDRLLPRNELAIATPDAEAPSGVALEIRSDR